MNVNRGKDKKEDTKYSFFYQILQKNSRAVLVTEIFFECLIFQALEILKNNEGEIMKSY